MKDQEEPLVPGLYMVATPIGNLEDISLRALRVLRESDWIAAEDTRHSRALLDFYGIQKQIYSFHEHSSHSRVDALVEKLKRGERGAYISDAGTPGICDPGSELVAQTLKEKLEVFPIPGASAPVTLLSASGFTASSFIFHGFFPREKKERIAWSERVIAQPGLHVFFESPHRLKECFHFLLPLFAENNFVVGRELTKRFETITRGRLDNVLEVLMKEDPRGEYVLILESLEGKDSDKNIIEIRKLLKDLASLGANQKVLLKVAMDKGLAKNEAYDLALEIKKLCDQK